MNAQQPHRNIPRSTNTATPARGTNERQIYMNRKQTVFEETVPIRELMQETLDRLQRLPRSTIACRQWAEIIHRVETWQARYMPDLAAAHRPETPGAVADLPYTREEVEGVLNVYRKDGYFALDEAQRKVLEWYEDKYVKVKL